MKPPAPFLALLLLSGCHSATKGPDPGNPLLCKLFPGRRGTITPSAVFGFQYLPKTFGEPTQLCWHRFRWYPECFPKIADSRGYSAIWEEASLWEDAEEPSLYELSQQKRAPDRVTIRFTWLPTLRYNPLVIRLEKSKDGVDLIANELSGTGYASRRDGRTLHRRLNTTEANQLFSLLKTTDIFNQPATDCANGIDGGTWIAESAENDDYRFIKRWSPQRGPIRDFGRFMVTLTGWYPESHPY